MKKLRVAYARIAQETNAFSTVPTTIADFESTHFVQGEALAEACSPSGHEEKAFAKNLELSGFVKAAQRAGWRDRVELVPLFSAWAVPSGPLTRAAFDHYEALLLEGLAQATTEGGLDGLFLSLHGAMGVEGLPDPEGALLQKVRAQIGPETKLAISLDLHANLSPTVVGAVDVLCGYRTNPHRDHARCGFRAGELLIRALDGAIKPTVAWRSLPMFMGGGTTVDFLPTMRPLFKRMKAMEKDPKVLYCSLFMCHPWNDSPELGWSVHITTDDAPELAETLAEELAEQAWAVRFVEPPEFSPVDAAIETARKARLARRLGAVVICDASDVVGAGGTGENTRIIKALHERGQGLLSYVPLRDPQAVEEANTHPVGEAFELRIGGRLDPTRNEALSLQVRLVSTHPKTRFGDIVVLEAGDLRLVLTSGPAICMKPAFYSDVGLKPWKADLMVVKSFFPFRLFFLPMNRKTIYVRTEGITDFDAAKVIEFAGPTHPKDAVHDWHIADARRRGLSLSGAEG